MSAGRCAHLGGGHTQCCRDAGHDDVHLFRCSSPTCPGLPWLASNTPHPSSCTVLRLASDDDIREAERLNAGGVL